jgi:hypothetical protein
MSHRAVAASAEGALPAEGVHGGGFEPYVRDHDISCGRQIRHLHEVERDWPTLEVPSVHENPESPPRLLERAKSVGDLEQDPYVSHRSKSRSSLDEPGVVPSGPSTVSTARSWQALLRSIASKGAKVFAAGAQGAPEERSQRPIPPLGRGQPPFGGQP